ncbi:unnamed protein product [Linum trigynum]|uniref:Uncharacterized protein n=1 Tax=Linum trigynum TaxID=586398 RepID=A0AAV2D613_9ROSI
MPNDPISTPLLESHVLWAGRVCVFYTLLKIGLARSRRTQLSLSGGDGSEVDIAGAGRLVLRWATMTKFRRRIGNGSIHQFVHRRGVDSLSSRRFIFSSIKTFDSVIGTLMVCVLRRIWTVEFRVV